jgi:hypothetical protein
MSLARTTPTPPANTAAPTIKQIVIFTFFIFSPLKTNCFLFNKNRSQHGYVTFKMIGVLDGEVRTKKGHHYIMPVSGPSEPASDTQAVPHTGH